MGDTQAAAGLAAATDVQVDYVPFSPQRAPEVQVTSVDVPSTVSANQQFDLNLSVQAEEATAAEISVFASGDVIYQEDVNLSQGDNRYSLSLESGESGFRDFRVQVEPQGTDGFYQNNQLSAFSRVIGSPRVLLLATEAEEAVYMTTALEEAGLEVDVRAPDELPIGVVPLAQYDSIIMANVPARTLSPARMDAVDSYVRDLGGGLVFVGGPQSYGPGGYFQTPIENALPVETRIRDQQRLPQLTIAYLVDTSGSMGMVGPSGVQNIELAKEAMIRSIEFLQPTDRAGAANFDTAGSWIADVQPVNNRRALQSLIATLRPGGGTDILAGMNLVAGELLTDPADRKHIILLTDGGASPEGLVELTERINDEADVTTSVIAIGSGAPGFLDDMAEAGDGNFYLIDNVSQIPTIFTQETVLATRSYIQEETFFPVVTANSPILNGITEAPPLNGYVATTPKQTATVPLREPGFNDPILAQWQYGLGRAVAFTSDASSRWGAEWVSWDGYSTFWSQAVQWTITESAGNNVEMRVQMDGEQARVIVDARDSDGEFLNGVDLDMSLVNPELESEQVTLQQVAPGRYEATFNPSAEGSYVLRVNGEQNGVSVNQTAGWVMSYSPEYDVRLTSSRADVLPEVARITSGRVLDPSDDAETVFEHNIRAQAAAAPIWMHLLIAALLLLPLDIAVRRLVVTRRDLQRAYDAVFGAAGAATQQTSERMASLFTARQRARQRTDTGNAPAGGRSGAETVSAINRNRDDDGEDAPAPAQPPKREFAPIADEETSFAALRRRQQGDDTSDDKPSGRQRTSGSPPPPPKTTTPAEPSARGCSSAAGTNRRTQMRTRTTANPGRVSHVRRTRHQST